MIDLIPRLALVEDALKTIAQAISDILQRIIKLEQSPWLATTSPNSGSGGQTVYFWVPGSTYVGSSGNPPTGTPNSVTGQTVYTLNGTSYSTVTTSATIRIVSPNSSTNVIQSGLVCYLALNSDGSYAVLTQSCT